VKITFPAAKPPPTEHDTPITLAISVLSRTTPGICTPFKKHLIWGIPDPIATGETKSTSDAAIETNAQLYNAQVKRIIQVHPESPILPCSQICTTKIKFFNELEQK